MIEYLPLVLTGIGIIASILYYTSVLSNQNKTRKAQLYLNLWSRWNTREFANDRYASYRMEWTNWEDFTDKYNPWNDWEAMASWNSFGRSINGIAELLKKGLIDIEFLDGEMRQDISVFWLKFGRLELENWERGNPAWPSHFPLIKEVIDYRRKNEPWLVDDDGDPAIKLNPSYVWVRPERIMEIRKKLHDTRS